MRESENPVNQDGMSFSPENLYYRAMTPDLDGGPKMGRNARKLGVRIPEDIAPDEKGLVRPGTAGMSVAPSSMWNIPNYRRPRGMHRGSTGPSGDFIYAIAEAAIPAVRLAIRSDPEQPQRHAFVEPATLVELSTYEANLASTRADWTNGRASGTGE